MATRAKKTKAKAGRALIQAAISGPPDVRSTFIDDEGKRWRWVVDNRMRDYGAIDYVKRMIRINREMHRRERESLIDTLFHEELHRLFPYLGERTICAMTRLLLPTLTKRYRAWLYARIRSR
jgi:hypothetical protein